MDIINSLSINMICLYKIPSFCFITRRKIFKNIKFLCKILRKENIFEISNQIYLYLKSLPDNILENCEIKVFHMSMGMNIEEGMVVYNAAKNEIEIFNNKTNSCYVIYKSARIPTYLKKDWLVMDDHIRNFYIEIISNLSYELAFHKEI